MAKLGCPIPALFLILQIGFLAKCSKFFLKNSHIFFFFFLLLGVAVLKKPKKRYFSIFLIFIFKSRAVDMSFLVPLSIRGPKRIHFKKI
jgi:hypothetical protein